MLRSFEIHNFTDFTSSCQIIKFKFKLSDTLPHSIHVCDCACVNFPIEAHAEANSVSVHQNGNNPDSFDGHIHTDINV